MSVFIFVEQEYLSRGQTVPGLESHLSPEFKVQQRVFCTLIGNVESLYDKNVILMFVCV